MSNRLKLFNSMSGMQKSIIEAKKEDLRDLEDKVATDTLDSSMGKRKSAAMLAHEILQADKANEANVKNLKAEWNKKIEDFTEKLKALREQETKANTVLAREQKKPGDEQDITKIKTTHARLSNVKAQIDELSGKLSLAKSDRDAEVERAEKTFFGASAKQAGKTRSERNISTKKLTGSNPLVVPVKSAEIGPSNLTFSQMSAVAHREAYSDTNESLLAFDNAIVNINKSIGFMLPEFEARIDKRNAIFKDPGVKKIFSAIRPDDTSIGQIEKNADLIKIFWLYCGGDSVLQEAKNNPLFVKALTKLEKTEKSPVTKPIASITSIDDIFTSENVKTVFEYFKDFAENYQGSLESIVVPSVKKIINAPESLYTGFYVTTKENIADTLYYSFINAFGTPEDKALLLKNPGNLGKASTFLTPSALDAIKLKIKDLTFVAEDQKQSASRSRTTSWGNRIVNTQYEKLGSKVLGATGGKFLREVSEDTAVSEKLDSVIGKVFDIAEPINAGYSLLNQIESLQKELKTVITPSTVDINKKAAEIAENAVLAAGFPLKELERAEKSPEVQEILKQSRLDAVEFFSEEARDLQTELSKLNKQVSSNSSQSLVNIRNLFLTGTPQDILSQIKQVFINRFDAVKKTITEDLEVLDKKLKSEANIKHLQSVGAVESPVVIKIKDLKSTITLAEQYMSEFLTGFDSITEDDINLLSDVFKASQHQEENETDKSVSSSKVSTKTEDGKLLGSWVKSILSAIDKYENQVPVTKEQFELQKKSDSLQREIDDIERSIETAAPELTEELNNRLTAALAEFDKIGETLNSYNTNSVSTTGDKRLANTFKVAFTSLLYHTGSTNIIKSNIDIITLTKLLNRMPTDIFKYLDPSETTAAYEVLDRLNPEDTKESSERKNSWKSSVRKALHKLSNHLNSSEVKDDKKRLNILKALTVPFTTKLEEVSDYVNITSDSELTDEVEASSLQSEIKHLKSRIAKNIRSGKSSAKDKKKLRRLEKGKGLLKRTVSFIPGSVFSGKAVVATDTNIAPTLLNNAKHLESNAKSFYNKILTMVDKLKLTDALYNKENPFSEGTDFSTNVFNLINEFKSNLSTDYAASDLEDFLFLDKFIQSNKLSQTNMTASDLDLTEIKKAFINNGEFADFLNILNQAVVDNSIWYEKKVINAPIIENLGLKSATLLNMLSCIKNFDSIEAFDLSDNRRNKNILASILDLKNYPKIFTQYDSTALMMKLYFLINLKQSVDAVNVINQFSTKFIDNTIEIAKTDKRTEELLAKLKDVNDTFENTVLQEFVNDFSSGGNLDTEIKADLELLWELASNMGDQIYSISDGILTQVSITKDNLQETVLQQGVNCIGTFNAEMLKKDKSLLNLLFLFDRNKTALRNEKLQQCISIIKTGLNFYVGLKTRELIGEHQSYNRTYKYRDTASFNEFLNNYYKDPKFAAFTSAFATKINLTNPTLPYKSTSKVSNLSKDGFMNLKNSFLMAFLKDFTTEAITKSVLGLNLDQAELLDADSEASETNRKAVEATLPIFVSGIFKKTGGKSETNYLDLDTEEAKSEIEATTKRNLKKTEKMLETGEAQSLSPVNISSVGKGDKEVLKLVVSVKKEGSYSRVSTAEESKRLGNAKSFSELTKYFADSLDKVCSVLIRIYSTGDKEDATLVEEIKTYTASIVESAPNIIAAISKVSTNPYNTELQQEAINLLSSIKALEAPDKDAVEELTSPTTAYTKALKSFSTKDGVFSEVYSFAQKAAEDLDKDNTLTIAKILEGINNLLKGDPAKFKNAELPKSLNTADTNTDFSTVGLSQEQIDNFSKDLFEKPLTEDAIINILSAIKNSFIPAAQEMDENGNIITSIKKNPTEATIAKINDIKNKKADQLTRISGIRQKISVLSDKIAQETATLNVNKPIERARPTNLANFSTGPMSPEEQSALTQRMANSQETLRDKLPTNGEYLTPAEEPLDESIVQPESDQLYKYNEALTKLKEELSREQNNLTSLEQDLIDLNKALDTIKEQYATSKMIKFLTNLYSDAVSSFNSLSKEVKSAYTSKRSVAPTLYNTKIIPIQSAVVGIIGFIKTLQSVERDQKEANAVSLILQAFEKFNADFLIKFTKDSLIPKDIKENIAKLALYKFNLLLEELEQPAEVKSEPIVEPAPIAIIPLTDREYMLSIARFLSDHGFKRAQDWTVMNESDPSKFWEGVKGSIQSACMLHFLGKGSGKNISAFNTFKYCLNSRTFIGFTANLTNEQEEKRDLVYVQFTKFNTISKVAAGDEETINSILNPGQTED